MIAAFLSGAAGEAGKQWAARILGPALVFWSTGLALVWYDHNRPRIQREGWRAALAGSAQAFDGLPAAVTLGLLPAAALLLVAGSAVVADRLARSVLRIFEGYWPAGWVRERRARRWVAARARAMDSYQRLAAGQAAAGLSGTQERELVGALVTLRAIPARAQQTLPTRLGNLLRAADLRSARKHGVDAVACWPRLWLVMPADTRDEVTHARQGMERSAQTWLWGALFLAWTPWAWWAPLAALAVTVVGYRNCLAAAADFGSLVESAFDVHLPLLYAAARLPAPPTAADEVGHGAMLSRYLTAGGADLELRFVGADGAVDDGD